MSQVKILWVQDEHEGPMNGLAEYNGEKVWFARINNPSIVSSTEIPVPYVETESNEEEEALPKHLTYTSHRDVRLQTEVSGLQPKEERVYILYRLSNDDMTAVVVNHVNHCQETGAPLNHGDAFRIRRRGRVVKIDSEVAQAMVPEGQDALDAEVRPLSKVKEFVHRLVPGEVHGKFLTTIKESEFTNYLVPRRVEYIIE